MFLVPHEASSHNYVQGTPNLTNPQFPTSNLHIKTQFLVSSIVRRRGPALQVSTVWLACNNGPSIFSIYWWLQVTWVGEKRQTLYALSPKWFSDSLKNFYGKICQHFSKHPTLASGVWVYSIYKLMQILLFSNASFYMEKLDICSNITSDRCCHLQSNHATWQL